MTTHLVPSPHHLCLRRASYRRNPVHLCAINRILILLITLLASMYMRRGCHRSSYRGKQVRKLVLQLTRVLPRVAMDLRIVLKEVSKVAPKATAPPCPRRRRQKPSLHSSVVSYKIRLGKSTRQQVYSCIGVRTDLIDPRVHRCRTGTLVVPSARFLVSDQVECRWVSLYFCTLVTSPP